MRLVLYISTFVFYTIIALAQPLSVESLYTNPENQKRSEALIIYNSENLCENCSQAISMLNTVLEENYPDKLQIYLIDTSLYPEFASKFSAYAPLTLVIIRISDGASFGYQKLTGLQSQTNDKLNFKRQITEFIDNFLGWN